MSANRPSAASPASPTSAAPATRRRSEELRQRKAILRAEDLGIDPLDAHRSLLAARSVKDLMHWSGDLYDPPAKYRNW